MIPLAWFGSYWLRFNLDGIPAEFWQQALRMLPLVLVVQGSLFWYFGLYRGVWRFASMPDLARILKATLTGVAVAAVAIFFLTRLQGVRAPCSCWTPSCSFCCLALRVLFIAGSRIGACMARK